MRVLSRSIRGALVAATTLGLLSACTMDPGKYTGGGTINSLGGAGRAQISFNADSCDPDNIKGQLTYNDKTAIEYQDIGGVSFQGKVVKAGMCGQGIDPDAIANPNDSGCFDQSELGGPAQCQPGQFAILFDYTSTNPRVSGTGRAVACSQTAGPGAGGGIHALVHPISVLTGPYQGYVNGGTLVGMAQQHACNAN